MPDASSWLQAPKVDGLRCDVIGLGRVQKDDGVVVLVSPSNTARKFRSHRLPSMPDTHEPDANKLEAVQQLVCAAGERPVILINPSLEALICTPRVDRPTRPMFLSDFEDAYFLAETAAPLGHVCAVRRVFPKDWEMWTASGKQAFQADGGPGGRGEQHALQLSRTVKARPNAAEMLCRQASSLRHGHEEARRLQRREPS